jgi:hypothetical protein
VCESAPEKSLYYFKWKNRAPQPQTRGQNKREGKPLSELGSLANQLAVLALLSLAFGGAHASCAHSITILEEKPIHHFFITSLSWSYYSTGLAVCQSPIS